MKIAIYGAGSYGQYIYNEIVNNECAKVSVIFWIDNFVEEQEFFGRPVYTEKEFLKNHINSEIDAVVIAINDEQIAQKITVSLLLQGYEKIYLTLPNGFLPKFPVLNEKGEFGVFIKFYKEIVPVASMILVLVTNNCNLNCKRCCNYSNLIKEKNILNLDKYESYLRQLKKKFKNILRFQLLGGEPLLNPQLDQYIALARAYFPIAGIEVVTNGVLIPNISSKLIGSMVRNHVSFYISQYIPTRGNLDKIIVFLEKNQIAYRITPPITQFRKALSLKENDGERVFAKRFHNDCGCHVIEEGRVYLCSSIPRLYAMQDYFDIHIEEEELMNSSIDLMSDTIDGWDIIKYFNHSAPLCRFCSMEDVWEDWETGTPRKEDWIVN